MCRFAEDINQQTHCTFRIPLTRCVAYLVQFKKKTHALGLGGIIEGFVITGLVQLPTDQDVRNYELMLIFKMHVTYQLFPVLVGVTTAFINSRSEWMHVLETELK